jgi:Fe-S-cluster-containing dehydrogenase component
MPYGEKTGWKVKPLTTSEHGMKDIAQPHKPNADGVEGSTPRHAAISRRKFLGTVAGLGGSALVAPPAWANKEFSGWPNSFGCLTDLTLCVGCRRCEQACNEANNLPPPETAFDDAAAFKHRRRPDARAYTVVNRYENPKKKDQPIYRKVQCNHCMEPACATACPVRAYTKTPEGAVRYDESLCIGCRYCMTACPFNAPAFDYASALEPKIVKCTLCHDRVKNGGMSACVEACPSGALTFGKRDELLKIARDRIAKRPKDYVDHIYGEHEVGGTNWLYISSVPFAQLGFPTGLPKTPLVEQTRGFLGAVPVVFTVWPALFGMCYAALRHREEGVSREQADLDPEAKHG